MSVLEVPVRRGPVDLTARWFLLAQTWVARWFWVIAVVVSAVAIAVYAVSADQVTTSVVGYGRQPLLWIPFAVFIGLIIANLPVHVASGLTRRTLSRGSLVAAVGTALLYGGAYAVLLLAERAFYGASGWDWQVVVGLPSDLGTTVAFLVANAVTLLVSYVSALLVAIIYLRGGGWWGTLTLPLTVGPLVLLSTAIGWGEGPFDDVPALLAGSALGLVLVVVQSLAYDVLVRGARVPPKR